MKFTIDRTIFQKAISKVDSVIPSREIRSHLANILIEAKNNTLTLTASDFELVISTQLETNVSAEGKTTLPARKLSQVISELQSNEITVVLEKDMNVKIKSNSEKSNAVISLMSLSADEYPVTPTIEKEKFNSISIELFLKMMNYTSYAMAKEDARYVFNGMYFYSDDKQSTIVTTDGRRLSLYNSDVKKLFTTNEGIIVPYKTIREIQKLATDENEVSIAYDSVEKRVFFKFNNTYLSSKLIDGTFPDYQQVVPKKVAHELKINKLDFENAIREVAVMAAEPSKQVKFSFTENNIGIYANTPDLGEAQNNIEVKYSGEELEIAFNSRYLLEVLKIIETEEIIFGVTSSTAPTVIRRPEDVEFIAIIMPMKV